MSIEAMKQALEGLNDYPFCDDERIVSVMSVLSHAIEKAEKQTPVAYCHPGVIEEDGTRDWTDVIYSQAQGSYDCPLYTTK